MNTFISSDHHLDHWNICKYCSRPFKSKEEMNEFLINEWNSIVEPEDHVYYLGDFGLAGPEILMPFRKRMNGIWKLFLGGNHDRSSMMKVSSLAETVIKYSPVKRYEIELEGIPFVMSHCPIKRENNDTRIYLFGHTHAKIAKETSYNNINIGIDSWNYGPVSIAQIKALI